MDYLIKAVAANFNDNSGDAWESYRQLKSWQAREQVADTLRQQQGPSSKGWAVYLQSYRDAMQSYIREDFYEALDDIQPYVESYISGSGVHIPFLKNECLEDLSAWAESVEKHGNSRYGTPRTVYPPGEEKRFKETDPRKGLRTDVNMVAVPSRTWDMEDAALWIYHSPHLQLFVQRIFQLANMYPYYNDLGMTTNIMRPSAVADQRMALGFHFDTINSSNQDTNNNSGNNPNKNPRGATGVIGVRDATVGGERVTWTDVSRNKVATVRKIVDEFNPLEPDAIIDTSTPEVVAGGTSGMLSLFDGGNTLHGVSSVRDGVRIALVFLYSEEFIAENDSNKDSISAFYGEDSQKM